jgi:hypothetical protein
MIPASRQRNYLQSALYVAIAGILATVLLERLLTYAEAAEKATVEATIGRLQSALYVRVAFLALRGEYDQLEALPRRSPFVVTHAEATNYLGEYDGSPPGDVQTGKWHFDRQRAELVYRPNLARYFEAPDGGGAVPELRFRVELQKTSKYSYSGVMLRPTVSSRWEPIP